ncbi:MAG TPA: tRNA glutamyl-Q(34) synthetase GluQRS, partial [Mycobacterium sp.]
LGALLGYSTPVYAHVPLVLNADGKRLAKRDGAVTLGEIGVPTALHRIAASLGFTATALAGMLDDFDPALLPRDPWIYAPF